MSLENFILW